MQLTTRDRIEKGLDRNGLMKLNNDLDTAVSGYRGLIYIEAKKDCSYTSMSWEKYLDGFLVGGQQISKQYADKLIDIAKTRKELSENFKKVEAKLSKTLNETEASLSLPKSDRTLMDLRGDNAIQKLRNWNDVKEATEKEEPTYEDVRSFNRAVRSAKEKLEKEQKIKDDKFNEYAKSRTVKTIKKPDAFTFEEELDFEEWCVKVHNFDVFENRPRGTKAIYALKDEKVGVLFSRLNEWKTAYKMMAKLCHPDTGGNSLAMSFLSDFKELMNSLKGIEKIVNYENKIEQLRTEYSTPKVGN